MINHCFAENSPPMFSNSTDVTAVMLTVNTTKFLLITAKDSDDDPIRFHVTGLPNGGVLTTNGSMVSILWNVTLDKVITEHSDIQVALYP